MNEDTVPTLTVACRAGLCNRLRVLLSGMVLAEAAGRRFSMLWPCTTDCSALFSELFENPWPVQAVTPAEWEFFCQTAKFGPFKLDLLAMTAADITVYTYSCLLNAERFPAHVQLWPRFLEQLALLQPTGDIQARIDEFERAAFRPVMIGVHLRRGDFHSAFPDAAANTRCAMAAVDGYLRRNPDAGILLCSDDGAINQRTGKPQLVEGIEAKFRRRYGDRVVATQPRSLDRREPAAIQDAVVDLWLLRRTDCFVGTVTSSFSEFVSWGRSAPVTRCQPARPLRLLVPVRHWLAGRQDFRWLADYYRPRLRALWSGRRRL